jgi:sugar phosphate isomerase/epimerase
MLPAFATLLAATLVLSFGCGPRASAAPAQPTFWSPIMRMLSLAHFTAIDADPVALIEAGAAGGFDAVGLRIVPPMPTDTIIPVIGDLPLQRAIKARMADTGVSILDVEAIWLTPETSVSALLPALDLAVELGAGYVLTCGHDPDWGRMTANLAQLSGAAHSRGLRVMLEFIPYTQVRNLAEAHQLLVDAAPENAGLLVDALHLSRSGGSPADLAQYDPALFSYMHLCDAPRAVPPQEGLRPEARGGRLYPGEGELWLTEFVAAFPPDVPVAIEAPSARHAAPPPMERARAAARAVRALLSDVGAIGQSRSG